ncbi:MAG: hypothetical protein KA201_31540 [Kofleriaceae bacterium]|nr:hypothetical protein [Kofleriaceae bacterium]
MRTMFVWEMLIVSVAAACVPLAPQPAPYGGGPAPNAPPPAQAAGSWGCTQVFECFATCAGDQACAQACLAYGDATSQAAALAGLQCVVDCSTSAEADCVDTQCSDEIEACGNTGPTVATPSPGGLPSEAPRPTYADPAGGAYAADRPRQPVTQSGVLAWLTGEWIGNNHQFVFYGDGRVRRSGSTAMYTDKGVYGCVSVINEIGSVIQDGDYLVMSFDAIDKDHCRDHERGAAMVVRYLIDWKENYSDPTGPLQIILREQQCTRGGTMYCDDPLRRR